MSQQVRQFHDLLLQDSSLKSRLKAATDETTLVELTVQLGSELGYSFTHKEVATYIDKNRFILMMQFSL